MWNDFRWSEATESRREGEPGQRVLPRTGALLVLLIFLLFLPGCGEQEEWLSLDEMTGEESSVFGEPGLSDSGSVREDESLCEDVGRASREEQAVSAAGSAADPGGREAGRGAVEACIYVYVCGAVNSPGVYELPLGSRAMAAVEAAGGMQETADETYVNLAASLTDGQKLLIPTREEAARLPAEEEAGADSRVNINTADVSQLCTLPGIGESRAKDIIRYREENGGFQRIEDIMKVPGIKESSFEKLKDSITAG